MRPLRPRPRPRGGPSMGQALRQGAQDAPRAGTAEGEDGGRCPIRESGRGCM